MLEQGSCCHVLLCYTSNAVVVTEIVLHVARLVTAGSPVEGWWELAWRAAWCTQSQICTFLLPTRLISLPINPVLRFHLPAHHRQMVWMTSLLKSKTVGLSVRLSNRISNWELWLLRAQLQLPLWVWGREVFLKKNEELKMRRGHFELHGRSLILRSRSATCDPWVNFEGWLVVQTACTRCVVLYKGHSDNLII